MNRRWLARGLGVVAIVALTVAYQRTAPTLAAQRTCKLVEDGDAAGAIEVSDGLEDAAMSDIFRLDGIECRARALLMAGRRDEAAALLARVLQRDDVGDWLPGQDATRAAILSLERTDRDAALRLAVRAALHWPDDVDVLARLVDLLAGASEGQLDVAMAEVLRGLPAVSLGSDTTLRRTLAPTLAERGRYADAAALLEGARWPRDPEILSLWGTTLCLAHAQLGDSEAVRRAEVEWARRGNAAEATLTCTYFRSAAHLPGEAPLEVALGRAVAAAEGKVSEADLALGYTRWAMALVAAGKVDEARAVYLAQRARFPQLRMVAPSLREGTVGDDTVVVRAPPGTLSYPAHYESAPSEEWTSVATDGEIALRVERGPAGFRYAWRSADGRATASGLAFPGDDDAVEVEPRPTGPAAPYAGAASSGAALPPPSLPRRAADGRGRLWVVVLDCADWRVLRYLRARGELPTFALLESAGWSAQLRQEPAFTAAAMRALTRPASGQVGFLTAVHDLGSELAGLSSVGRNPLAALGALLPASADLVELLGQGDREAANALFSHGNINAGAHAVVVGPRGRATALDLPARRGDPVAALASYPSLAAARAEAHVAASADDLVHRFDQLDWLADRDAVDTLLYRVEAFDLLTHALFADALVSGQDDGHGALFDVYRYADARLRGVLGGLDADDTLVVMSDHGIRTAVEHDPAALFFVVGPGVPVGRAEGTPELRGVGAVLAALSGVEAELPDTGVAPWATASRGRAP